jgi:hypothetical protein
MNNFILESLETHMLWVLYTIMIKCINNLLSKNRFKEKVLIYEKSIKDAQKIVHCCTISCASYWNTFNFQGVFCLNLILAFLYKVPYWLLKDYHSSLVNSNIKSSVKGEMFLIAAL